MQADRLFVSLHILFCVIGNFVPYGTKTLRVDVRSTFLF